MMEEMRKVEAMLGQPEEIRVPEQALDYIRAGIRDGQKLRQRRRRLRKVSRLLGYSGATVLVLLGGLIGMIRFSPVVASGLSQVPLLQQLVEMVRADRSIQLAAQYGYVQHVGAMAEQDGIQLTIDSIIADEWRIVLFYTLRYDEERYSDVRFGAEFYDAREERLGLDNRLPLLSLPSAQSWPPGSDLVRSGNTIQGKQEYRFIEPQQLPSRIKLKAGMRAEMVQLGRSIPLLGEWVVELPVDHAKFYGKQQHLEIGQTVAVDGQLIHFRQATLYPTVIQLDFEYDAQNDKQLFKISDLRLVDDTGREWAPIVMNGDSLYASDSHTVYFESMYFETPRSLTLSGSRIYALDKEQMTVSVDLDSQTLLTGPTDRLKLESITTVSSRFWPDAYELSFVMEEVEGADRNERPMILFPDRDADGNRVGGQSHSGFNDGAHRYVIKTKDKNLVSPITFQITDYRYHPIVSPFQVVIPIKTGGSPAAG